VLGHGPVIVEQNEPVFHHAWEGLAFALNMVSIGRLRAYNADTYRHSVERVSQYLSRSYYERLLTGVSTLLVEGGIVGRSEIEELAGGRVPLSGPVAPNTQREAQMFSEFESVAAKLAVGDLVRVVAGPTTGHTRCPAYLRNACGKIERVYGLAHVPEVRAHSSTRYREHTYAVIFDAGKLWPEDSGLATDHTVIVEVFESYLEPVAAQHVSELSAELQP
jgi:nitrile hydratase subunit beta